MSLVTTHHNKHGSFGEDPVGFQGTVDIFEILRAPASLELNDVSKSNNANDDDIPIAVLKYINEIVKGYDV